MVGERQPWGLAGSGSASVLGVTGGGGSDGYCKTYGGGTSDSLDRIGLTLADIWLTLLS